MRAERIGVVGASSLKGKELSDELAESALAAAQTVLLDDADAAGQLTAAGEEAQVIQQIDATSFEGLDFAFFAGEPETTRAHWQRARRAGAAIVDMSYALEGESSVPVRAPWIRKLLAAAGLEGPGDLDLTTTAVVSAHPAALMLAVMASKLRGKLPVTHIAATVLEPASEYGRAAMDELHQQTVSLLSFKDLPREQYDTQIAFNVLPTVGEESKVSLNETAVRIERHFREISGGQLPELALQVVHAPVFHGHTASVLVELGEAATLAQVEMAVAGEYVDLLGEESDPPSNLSSSGQRSVLAKVRAASASGGPSKRFWMWLATDNLKLAAANAIACAVELRRLRPTGKVQ